MWFSSYGQGSIFQLGGYFGSAEGKNAPFCSELLNQGCLFGGVMVGNAKDVDVAFGCAMRAHGMKNSGNRKTDNPTAVPSATPQPTPTDVPTATPTPLPTATSTPVPPSTPTPTTVPAGLEGSGGVQ